MKFLFSYFFRKMPRTVTMKHTSDFENLRAVPLIFSRYAGTKVLDDEFEYDVKHVDVPSFADEYQSKLRPLILEIDLLRQMDVNSAPEKLNAGQWKVLSEIKDKSDRIKFCKSLIVEKKIQRCDDNVSVLETSTPEENSKDSLFLHVTESRINRFYNYKLILAELFGPTLIVDCNYENLVAPHLLHSLIDGLLNVWFINREASNPFHIIYCNVDKYGELFRQFSEKFFKDVDLRYMLNVVDDDYTELFPSTHLVYLTPNSKCEIGKFNGRDILIMGGFVDDISDDFSALIVCKKEKLRHGKFPIDTFTIRQNKTQNQMLTSEEFIRIISDVKNGVSWSHAFRHIDKDRMKITIRNQKENQRIHRISLRVFGKV